MKKILFSASCLLWLTLFSFTADAQTDLQKNSLGIGAGARWGNGWGARPAFSIDYERRLSFRSGLETGIHYANLTVSTLTSNTGLRPAKTHYHLFTLPILYRLHTTIADIAAGPSFNVLSGPSQSSAPGAQFQKDPGKPAIGYAFKISKPIRLDNHLVLDPEAGIRGNQYFKRPQGAVGIGLKYRF